MRSAIFLALALAPSAATADESLGRIELACLGGGSASKIAGATVNAWGNNGYAGGATIMGKRSVGFDDQVSLWIEGEDGRVRMPRSMLPPIHGGDDGWFKLKSVKTSNREITASISVNALNNPKLRLDRYTGSISISGKAGDFTGQCRKYDPATEQRAF